MLKQSALLFAIFTTSFTSASCGSAFAEMVKFPPAPVDATAAVAAFDKRAAVVTRYNACGRELDYATYRNEMLDGNYKSQGEGLSTILIAKIAWLTDARYSNEPCELILPRPKRGDGSFVHGTWEELTAALFGHWIDPRTPTTCSYPTSRLYVRQDHVLVEFHVTRGCLRQQVNEAVRAMVKHARMGTENLPCIGPIPVPSIPGDFDVNVRELVRILYMGTLPGREVLSAATIDHMYKELLAARGDVSDASYSLIADCGPVAGDELGTPEDYADREYWYNELLEGIADLFKWLFTFPIKVAAGVLSSTTSLAVAPFLIAAGENPNELIAPRFDIEIPETENHRLMIETSKYLTNAKIIERLKHVGHDNVDEIEEKQAKVRDWLLQTLRSISINDFDEYNSRPYTRYSLNAILNLYDFADDHALRTASQIVLDLSAAKFAAASNRGRRVVPFRRLADNDDTALYENVKGADHEVTRAPVLAGQTQLLPDGFDSVGVAYMIYAAVSSYRAPRPVLEVSVERKQSFSQDIRHAGVEGYFSSPAFTMSLGGVRLSAALDAYGIEQSIDRGVAMPSVIIPTGAGHWMEDLFAMRGIGNEHERPDNLCGSRGFICGIRPQLSKVFSACTSLISTSGADYFFVNSAGCLPEDAKHFYLALKVGHCADDFCARGQDYGLMEIVEAPADRASLDAGFQAFRTQRLAALQASVPDSDGIGHVSKRDLGHNSVSTQ